MNIVSFGRVVIKEKQSSHIIINYLKELHRRKISFADLHKEYLKLSERAELGKLTDKGEYEYDVIDKGEWWEVRSYHGNRNCVLVDLTR